MIYGRDYGGPKSSFSADLDPGSIFYLSQNHLSNTAKIIIIENIFCQIY